MTDGQTRRSWLRLATVIVRPWPRTSRTGQAEGSTVLVECRCAHAAQSQFGLGEGVEGRPLGPPTTPIDVARCIGVVGRWRGDPRPQAWLPGRWCCLMKGYHCTCRPRDGDVSHQAYGEPRLAWFCRECLAAQYWVRRRSGKCCDRRDHHSRALEFVL